MFSDKLRVAACDHRRRPRTLDAIRVALEAAGVEFTNGDAPGVRLRKVNPEPLTSGHVMSLRFAVNTIQGYVKPLAYSPRRQPLATSTLPATTQETSTHHDSALKSSTEV